MKTKASCFLSLIILVSVISGCSTLTKSTEYKALKKKVDSLQSEVDGLQETVNKSDEYSKNLQDAKKERIHLIKTVDALLDTPLKRNVVLQKYALPNCESYGAAQVAAMSKTEYDTKEFYNVIKELIGDQADDWFHLLLSSFDETMPNLKALSSEASLSGCIQKGVSTWLKDNCVTFDSKRLKKTPLEFMGKCLKGYVKIVQADSNTGPCAFQGYIGGDYAVRAQFGMTSDANTQRESNICNEQGRKNTEGRTVYFYAIVIQPYTYTTTAKNEATIPAFKILAGG